MKNEIKNAALLAIAGMLSINMSAQGIDSVLLEKTKNFQLNIELGHNESDSLDTFVKVYRDSMLIAVLNSTMQKKMSIEFEKDKNYMIEISEPGYLDKSILISTVLPKEASNDDNIIYEHTVSVSLDKSSKSSAVGMNTKNTPVGIIHYSAEEDNFIGESILAQAGEIVAQIK